jgi:hypothetical protein
MSAYEWLESTAKRITPGVCIDCQTPKKRFVLSLLAKFGFPIEASYDIVTIGKNFN